MNIGDVRKQKAASIALYFLITIYIASLPYAIGLFNLLLQLAPLRVLKMASLCAVIACLIAIAVLHIRQRIRIHMPAALSTVAGIMLVCWIESNEVKYIHIPQYALLALLLHAIFSRTIRVSSLIYAVLFNAILIGIFDELHQGLHHARYFGWRDMIINSVGVLLGITYLASRASNGYDRNNGGAQRIRSHGPLIIASMALLPTIYFLLDSTVAGFMRAVYPVWWLGLNWLFVLTIPISLLFHPPRLRRTATQIVWHCLPLGIIWLINTIVVFTHALDIPFR